MTAPNKAGFSNASFMIGFKMPFNSKYQRSSPEASDRSLWQGLNTDHFPEVCVAIIHDIENCCPRGVYL